MIIANIGHTQFLLKDIDEAQTILGILNNSTTIESEYQPGSSNYLYHESQRDKSIEISLMPDAKILTHDEYQALKANQPPKED